MADPGEGHVTDGYAVYKGFATGNPMKSLIPRARPYSLTSRGEHWVYGCP